MNNQKFQWIHGIAGHAVDLKNMLAMQICNPHSYTKYRQLVAVGRRCHATDLIETGTFRGVTTHRAARHFKTVSTIELDPQLHAESSEFLKKHSHVNVILGDAAVQVKRLLEESNAEQRFLLFLDGHFSGGCTAHGDEAEPALQILEDIAVFKSRVGGIIVDDFREFGTQKGWPKKHRLIETCERCFDSDEFKLSVNQDQVILERVS